MYRSHLKEVLRYQYPDHYGIVLKLLLRGCAAGKIDVDIWQDFLECIGAIEPTAEDSLTPTSHVQSLSPGQVCSFFKFEGGHPERGCKMRGVGKICDF